MILNDRVKLGKVLWGAPMQFDWHLYFFFSRLVVDEGDPSDVAKVVTYFVVVLANRSNGNFEIVFIQVHLMFRIEVLLDH